MDGKASAALVWHPSSIRNVDNTTNRNNHAKKSPFLQHTKDNARDSTFCQQMSILLRLTQ